MTVYSHPCRPELGLLRIFLAGQEYSAHARERIVCYAAREGTLEGCPELEPEDMEGAELVFVDGMEPVSQTDPEWEDPAIAIDLDTLLEHGRPRIDFDHLADAEEAEYESYLDHLTDEQIDALAGEQPAPELVPEDFDQVEPANSDAPDSGPSRSAVLGELLRTGRVTAVPPVEQVREWCDRHPIGEFNAVRTD